MNIADADLREMLPSGTQTKFDNRIAWAKSYFVQANVLESQGSFALPFQGVYSNLFLAGERNAYNCYPSRIIIIHRHYATP
jgi:hypothetical protein